MSKLPSSKQIITTLLNNGFIHVSQRGSHAKYKKGNRTVIVPSPKKRDSNRNIEIHYQTIWFDPGRF